MDDIIRWIGPLFSLVTLLLLIFKGGGFIGRNTEIVDRLHSEVSSLKSLAANISIEIAELKVTLDSINRNIERHEHTIESLRNRIYGRQPD